MNSPSPGGLLAPVAVPKKWHYLALLIALAGGLFGILGAFFTEFFRGDFLVAFVGAPIIEEVLKPSGLYLLLAKWPRALRSQFYTAMLAAFGGIAFAVIENIVYLTVYIENPTSEIILWRWTVNVAVHAVCSFIFGFGINWKLAASVRGQRKLLSSGKRFFFPAMALHSAYNITVTVLSVFTDKLAF